MNPWVILSLQLSSGQLKIEGEDSDGHRFPAARPWVGLIPATVLRGAGLSTQPEVLVPEVWPPAAGVVYLRLPASIASRDWDPLIRIVLGYAASVARYVASARGGMRPFELPLRIVSMNQVRPYLDAFLRHNWVKETQRRGGLEINFTADVLETLHSGTWHVLLTPEKRLGHVLSGIGSLPARQRPALVLSVPEAAAEAATLPSIPRGTTLYRFSKQATGQIQEGIDSWMHDLIHLVPWPDIVATKAGTIYTGPHGVQGIHLSDIAEQLHNRHAYTRGLAETIRLLKPGTDVNMPSVPSRIDLRFDREATSIEPVSVSLQDLSATEQDLKQRIPATLTPEQEQALADKQQRRVDIAFRGATPPHDYIHPNGHLTTGGECLVCVRVGQAFETSVMSSAPPPIDPLLPKRKTGHRLQVVLFAKNATVKGAASRTLTLPQFGPSNTLAFRVLLPKNGNTLDARLSVYYRNQLLQSFSILADNRGIRAELDFSQTSRFQNLAAFQRREASFAINADAGASHSIMLFRDGATKMLAFSPETLKAAREQFKAYLADITGTSAVPKFDTYPLPGAAVLADFHAAVRKAAELGYRLWKELFDAAPDEKFEDVLRALRRKPACEDPIQIVRLNPKYSYPWQIVYDWDLPGSNQPPQDVCLGTLNGAPCKHTCASGVVCLNGFWSMRYVIEQLIGSGSNLQDIAVETSVKKTTGAVLLSTDEEREDLEALRTELKDQLKDLDSEGDLVEQIWDPVTRPAIALIYGHTEIVDVHERKGVVRITLPGNRSLYLQDFDKKAFSEAMQDPRPAVFLLACQTTMVDPSQLGSFLSTLHHGHVAAILGTEWLAFRSLLARFAREMTMALWSGAKLGPAMRDFRRHALIAGNPLPFAFQAIGSADYHLKFEEHR
jgi:hypothetical protein